MAGRSVGESQRLRMGTLYPPHLLQVPVTCPACGSPVMGLSVDTHQSPVRHSTVPCGCEVTGCWAQAMEQEIDRRRRGLYPRDITQHWQRLTDQRLEAIRKLVPMIARRQHLAGFLAISRPCPADKQMEAMAAEYQQLCGKPLPPVPPPAPANGVLTLGQLTAAADGNPAYATFTARRAAAHQAMAQVLAYVNEAEALEPQYATLVARACPQAQPLLLIKRPKPAPSPQFDLNPLLRRQQRRISRLQPPPNDPF